MGIFFLEKYTPFYLDDYIHKFTSSSNPDLKKYVIHYIPFIDDYSEKFSHVSRFVPHLLVTLCRLMNPNLFAFIVAFAFILFCFLCGKVASSKLDEIIPMSFIISFLLFFLFPGFFVGFLWLSGTCNYLFVSILILTFYILLTSCKIKKIKGYFHYILLFLYGFITGWTNEGFVIGLAISTFIYYFFLRRNELNISRLFLLVGFYLGALNLCLTPWNLYRFFESRGGISFTNFLYQILGTLFSLTQIRILPILLFALSLYYFIIRKNKNHGFRNFIKSYLLIELSLLFTFLFILTTNFTNIGSRIPIEFYALVLLICLISKLNFKYLNKVSTIFAIVTILIISYVFPSARLNYKCHLDMAKQIMNNEETIITKSFNPPYLAKRFMIPLHKQYDYNSFPKPYIISQYYGNSNNPPFIEESIYKKITKNQTTWVNLTEFDGNGQWIKYPNNLHIDSVILILRPFNINEIPFYLRPMKDKLVRFTLNEIPISSFDSVTVFGKKWLVISEYPMKEIATRQKSLRIIYHSMNDTIKRMVKIDCLK